MLSSLPLGWKIAVRLIGGWVFAWLLTGLVKPEPGQVSARLSGLDLWSCFWFGDSEHQTTLGRGSSLKSLLSNLACMDLLPKGLKYLKSLLEGVSLTTAVQTAWDGTVSVGPSYFTLSTHERRAWLSHFHYHKPQLGRLESIACLPYASVLPALNWKQWF